MQQFPTTYKTNNRAARHGQPKALSAQHPVNVQMQCKSKETYSNGYKYGWYSEGLTFCKHLEKFVSQFH